MNGATVVYLWTFYEQQILRIQGEEKRKARRIAPTDPFLLVIQTYLTPYLVQAAAPAIAQIFAAVV